MSAKLTNAKEHKRRFSRLSIASGLCVVLSFVILYFRASIVYPRSLRTLVWNIIGLVGVIGFLIGILAIEQIMRSRWVLRGGVLAIASIILTALLWNVWLLERIVPRSFANRFPCATNLSQLGKAMLLYANDHKNRYPDPSRWCDLLLEQGEVDVTHFICPSTIIVLRWPFKGGGRRFIWPVPKKGRCHYAMNPNCGPNSPPDMVLLFESKEGWNLYGGPELLTAERHGGDGFNILCNDCSVTFYERSAKLKWKEAEIKKESKN